MQKNTNLETISDGDLLSRLSKLVKQSRRVESEIVAHIAEVDARKLYAREASPSMHKYCVDVLRLSDAEAYFRIAAARASRRHPVLLTMLEDGRLHLSGIEVLAPHLGELSEAERKELLARATHKTKREVKELVAELAPRPDVPPCIRKVPEPGATKPKPPLKRDLEGATCEPWTSSQRVTPSGRSTPNPSTRGTPKPRDARKHVEPLSPARYKVTFTASAELRDRLERLSALMPGMDLAGVIESAVTDKLERIEAKRFAQVKRPRKNLEEADTRAGVRGVSAPVKRHVWARDGGRCTFRGPDGKRCPERHRLEFHHDEAFALGGGRSTDNIRLLCKTHNLYMAELDYGKAKIDPYRRSVDRVREPTPSFELALERVPANLPETTLVSFASVRGPAP